MDEHVVITAMDNRPLSRRLQYTFTLKTNQEVPSMLGSMHLAAMYVWDSRGMFSAGTHDPERRTKAGSRNDGMDRCGSSASGCGSDNGGEYNRQGSGEKVVVVHGYLEGQPVQVEYLDRSMFHTDLVYGPW